MVRAEIVSRPVWGAWIEIEKYYEVRANGRRSRPVWGAWIEIISYTVGIQKVLVAPRMGRVD